MTNEEMDEYPTFSDKWEKNIVYFNKIKAQAKLANAQQSIIDRCEPWLKKLLAEVKPYQKARAHIFDHKLQSNIKELESLLSDIRLLNGKDRE